MVFGKASTVCYVRLTCEEISMVISESAMWSVEMNSEISEVFINIWSNIK
jgi:hypothetical protein